MGVRMGTSTFSKVQVSWKGSQNLKKSPTGFEVKSPFQQYKNVFLRYLGKVRIFWEGHKNLPPALCSIIGAETDKC